MRLTLRTMIAWLDDKLSPHEVREIGQQVAESPFAKELVQRVKRVTRQRRLSVPGDKGVEGVDPNLVASYLDNELSPEKVSEYEKLCLTSDVNLAEVASVHQILSLIGQKAKVPPEARLRMYRLIKGREASGHSAPSRNPKVEKNGQKAAAADPTLAWSAAAPKHRPLIERFGPIALVLGLIGVLAVAATYTLSPEGTPPEVALNQPEPREVAPLPLPQVPVEPPVENPSGTEPRTDEASTQVMDASVEVPKDVDKPDSSEPGVIDSVQGLVLRPSTDGSGWDRVEPKETLKEGSRLLNLDPFRNTIRLGKSEVELVGSTDVVVDQLLEDQPARLDLRRGRILLRPSTPPATISMKFDDQKVAITPPDGVAVGIERTPRLLPGQSEPVPAHVRIFLPQGEATLKVDDREEKLEGPGEITLQMSGQFTERGRQTPPTWVTEQAPSTFVKEIGDQFVALLRPGRPILSDLVEAMDDPQKDVKRMAVEALGSIGAMELVVTVLDRKEDPAVHRTVVEVLRAGLAQGGETAKVVREALVRQYGDSWAAISERLIIGFSPEEAKEEATTEKLVEYLTAPSRGTRELAIDNLRAVTGRDSLEYDPDSPEGKGLKAWQDLIRKSESKPASGTPR
ncbi:hypothetical protein P12x_001361 [Tundrisphaera lichenicola]|uniref:HEAT repeat domain-containing protein n=1 Tax=Tundrisphaera lichenicola TaxID=2029860 RepID=UPI003EBF3B54